MVVNNNRLMVRASVCLLLLYSVSSFGASACDPARDGNCTGSLKAAPEAPILSVGQVGTASLSSTAFRYEDIALNSTLCNEDAYEYFQEYINTTDATLSYSRDNTPSETSINFCFKIEENKNQQTDSFSVVTGTERLVTISAQNTKALIMGANFVLSNIMGLEMLFPGREGRYIPEDTKTKTFQISDLFIEPDFETRHFGGYSFNPSYGLTTCSALKQNTVAPEQEYGSTGYSYEEVCEHYKWLQSSNMDGEKIEAGHNLLNIFDPRVLLFGSTAAQPELYPIVGGQRLPLNASDHNWQPILDHPNAIRIAKEKILNDIASNPLKLKDSYSLSMNDSPNWGDSVLSNKPINGLGVEGVSDYYFQWANNLASELNLKPEFKFGTFGYRNLFDPPSFPINKQVLPYLTYDRLRWNSDLLKTQDKQRITAWSQVSQSLGVYDYMYGHGSSRLPLYTVPRLSIDNTGDFIKFAHRTGVRHYRAEVYPSKYWLNGPLNYIVSKLLWDSTLNTQSLLDSWTLKAVGNQAAPHLKNYYVFWNSYWKDRVSQSHWFKNENKNVEYLNFVNQSYLSMMTTQDVNYLQNQMDQMLSKSSSPARAQKLFQSWTYIKGALKPFLEIRDFMNSNAQVFNVPNSNLSNVYSETFSQTSLDTYGSSLSGAQSAQGVKSTIGTAPKFKFDLGFDSGAEVPSSYYVYKTLPPFALGNRSPSNQRYFFSATVNTLDHKLEDAEFGIELRLLRYDKKIMKRHVVNAKELSLSSSTDKTIIVATKVPTRSEVDKHLEKFPSSLAVSDAEKYTVKPYFYIFMRNAKAPSSIEVKKLSVVLEN